MDVMKMSSGMILKQTVCFLYWAFIGVDSIRHGRNLIWTQTPSLKIGVSRIVGIEGDPSTWVPSGNVNVRHISAPHIGWQFKALAFNYATQTLYWSESTNKKIQGLILNGTTETATIFTGTSNMAEGLAVDWLSNNIYWTDSLYNWIIMAPLGGGGEPVYKFVVRTGLTNPHSVAIHPQKGYLFWSDWGTVSKIEVSDLLGQNRRTVISEDIGHPRGMAIDYADQLLYWVDSQKDTVESAEFNGNNRRLIAYQAGTIFFGIAVFKESIFITEQLQGHLRVYDKKTGKNEINYQLGYVPDGIIMYDAEVQQGNSSECDAAGCQQICVLDPLAGPVCRCGEGYKLQEDLISCEAIKEFGQPSHVYAIRDAICQYPVNLPDMSLYNITLESQCFMKNGRGHYALTFDARAHMMYYSENVTGSIGRVSLEAGESGENIIKGVGNVQGMALDWLTGNLFWTDMTYSHISMAVTGALYPTALITDLDKPLGIAVHPERGQVFWTEIGANPRVMAAAMDGSQSRELTNSSMVGIPNHLYLDYANDRLYWADSGLFSVRCVDLQTLSLDVIYENIADTVTFFGISLYQDYLLWTDQDDQKNGIHAVRLDKLEKVRGILHPHAGLASDLITIDIKSQPPMKSACEGHTCQQICIPTSNVSYICSCGVGWTLDENLKTCSTKLVRDNYLLTVDSYQKHIYQIDLNTGAANSLPTDRYYKGVALDIHPLTGDVFLTDNQMSAILKLNIYDNTQTIFRKLPNDSIADGIAVDYVNQLLFYTCTSRNIIVVVSLLRPSLYKTIVNDSLDEPRDVIVHSEEGMIYWTDWGQEPKIEGATMDGGNRKLIVPLQNNSWPNAIALDSKTRNLFWLDARHEVIGRMNLDSGVKKIIHTEKRAHFFGMTIVGKYLYITDWFRKHVSRMSVDGGGKLEQVGPSKFSRLNGIAGYRRADVRTEFSVCLKSECSQLCLPVSSTAFKCACSDEGKQAKIPCMEKNEITTKGRWTPGGHGKVDVVSALKSNGGDSGSYVGLAIGCSILGVAAIAVIVFGSVYFYKRRQAAAIPHGKLVEDTGRIDSFYRITFPDSSKEEANFDSGIENPSFASSENIHSSGNIVRYSPM